MRKIFFALALFIAIPVFAQDPAEVGPGIYSEQFENERVRVLIAEFMPGEAIAVHSHPDHLGYVLSGGKLEITGTDGKAEVFDVADGATLFLPAQSHSAVNRGDTTIKVLIVELKDEKMKRMMTVKD